MQFQSDVAAKAAAAEENKQNVIQGKSGWLCFTPELRAISVGEFWGADAAKASRASNTEYADAFPAIVDFHKQLKDAGIELLVVPVPAKVSVYPEIVSGAIRLSDGKLARPDVYHQQFYEALRTAGVQVIDLVPHFVAHRVDKEGYVYCKSDTHWSGRGSLLAAQLLAEQIKDRPWLKEVVTHEYASEQRDVEITGDLAAMIDEENPVRETLPLTFVGTRGASGLQPVEPARDSPVLLMGDSHTLVFHDPGLHAKGAGLPDHLALQLGFPVDLIGVRGSGATATRISLLRRGDNLAGKKLVIWCFSMREFTESFDGWRPVPVIR